MYIELYVIASFIVGLIGTTRKLGFFLAFIISLFASPIVGILCVVISPAKEEPSLIWYKCKWCGFRSQKNSTHCPKCALDDNGAPA